MFLISLIIRPKIVIKNVVVVIQIRFHHASDIVFSLLNFQNQINHLLSVDAHLVSNSFHFISVFGYIIGDFLFVGDQNVLNFLNNSNVAMIPAFVILLEAEISRDQETVKLL